MRKTAGVPFKPVEGEVYFSLHTADGHKIGDYASTADALLAARTAAKHIVTWNKEWHGSRLWGFVSDVAMYCIMRHKAGGK
jgi:hypothetical protein